MNLPPGARQIVEARQSGHKPELGVVVSFVGSTDLDGPHVYPRSGEVYDWRFLRDLQVSIVVKRGVDAADAMRKIFAETMPTTGYPWILDLEAKHVSYLHNTKPRRSSRINPNSQAYRSFFPCS